ncbi:hypothetical protein [Amycolatopsis sp. NPDC059021]|uniref:hypothetical protein n=1 Tax=Amycolatopsis sp. NPDC059021 TaxID=3346704 RepID=UPI00366F1B52
MNESEFLAQLSSLRTATVQGERALHKPVMVLWLLHLFVNERRVVVSYDDAEEPLGQLIAEFGKGTATRRDRASLPFVHLERTLWELRDRHREPIANSPSRSGAWLREQGGQGNLRAEVRRLLNKPSTLHSAIDALLEYFDPQAAEEIQRTLRLNLRAYARSSPLRRPSKAVTERVMPEVDESAKLDRLLLPTEYDSFDHDTRLRWQAFVWLADVIRSKGRRLAARDLRGFSFEGKDMQLTDQQGIWKPAGLSAPLSIRTTYTPPNKARPYEDNEDSADGLIRYKYRGTDPQLFVNRALRQAMLDKRPLIWFKAVGKSVYEPYFPFWVIADEPEKLQIVGSFASPSGVDPAWKDLIAAGAGPWEPKCQS